MTIIVQCLQVGCLNQAEAGSKYCSVHKPAHPPKNGKAQSHAS